MNGTENKVKAVGPEISRIKDKYRFYLLLVFLLTFGLNWLSPDLAKKYPVPVLVVLIIILVIFIVYIKYMVKLSRGLGLSKGMTFFYVLLGNLPVPLTCLIPAIFLLRKYRQVTGVRVGLLMQDKKPAENNK